MADHYQTVCIVDDDPSVCKALSRIIKLSGFKVKAYASAKELFDDKQLENIDLLLLDIRMPVMDGFTLNDHLVAAGFRIPCIFMTAHDVEKAQSIAMEKNAVAFLRKPFEGKDLLNAIDKGLSNTFLKSTKI